MKKLTLLLIAGIACSCNNTPTTTSDVMEDSTTTATQIAVNYPYTIEHPDYWEIGSTANTMAALKCLNAWEVGNIDESLSYFADSVRISFDGLDKTMSKDSLKVFLVTGWNNFKSVKEKMHDWVSVISKDKTEEWVTLWYQQSWETKNGARDSSDIVNDVQFKNGKIIRLVEYTRKLH